MPGGNGTITAEPRAGYAGAEAGGTYGEERFMSEDRVIQALRALSEHDASWEASPEVEARLRVQFQSRKRRGAWRRAAVWGSVAAAAAMVVFVVVAKRQSHAPAPVHEIAKQAVAVQPEVAP